jgi:hypothetical protein
MLTTPSSKDQVRFLLDLQRLLEEGSFAATYKHALLLSIADVCVEKGDDSSRCLRINTGELAEKFISYYWRQALPYQPIGQSHTGAILKQNTGKQAAIISAISKARTEYDGSLAKLEKNSRAWKRLKRDVAEVIRIMPLWKLQTVGRQRLDFLYPHDPNEGHQIELNAGVCFCFRLFYGLIHELVRGAWLRFIRIINENKPLLGDAADLSGFLFGSSRASLEMYRPILMEYQRGDCFYCLRPLKERSEVDHFIPWSRYPVDFGHNFVLAHSMCNTRKADRLAAVEHLGKWCRRNEKYGSNLAAVFQEKNIVHDLQASWRITTWAYEQAQIADSLVWKRSNELVPLTSEWRILLHHENYV